MGEKMMTERAISPQGRGPGERLIRIFYSYQALSSLLVFVLLVVIFGLFTPQQVFIGSRNLNNLLRLIPDLGIVALGVGMLMIAGEFDLSISSTIPLHAYIFALMLRAEASSLIIVASILILGPLLGLLNGLLTTRVGLPSFIATLGMMMFWRGVVYVASRRSPIGIGRQLAERELADFFIGPGFLGVPRQMWWFLFFAVVLGLILRYHRFGNWVYVTGNNSDAARAMGINTDYVKIVCFMVVGFLAAFTGLAQTMRIRSFTATQAQGFELEAIAAAVIGGTSLFGGVGSMAGAFLGVVTVKVLENGLILMGVPVFGITAFTGGAVILAVILNTYIERRRLRG